MGDLNLKTFVATDKAKLFAYVDPALKVKIEQLADARLRSVSNLVEAVMLQEVRLAEQTGELPTDLPQNLPGKRDESDGR